MDTIGAMQLFRRVVESGSFSAVARETGLSQPTVSKQIASLETHLSIKLINRSTRQLRPTDAGLQYYERCCLILDELDETEAIMREQQTVPTGTLRVHTPVTIGRTEILPRLWKFLDRYPELKFDLHMDDNYVDLVKEGIDVAVRIGPLTDSSLIAQKIGDVQRYTVASPEYLAKYGEPKTLADLLNHDCLVYSLLTTNNQWYFTGLKGKENILVQGKFTANSPDAIRGAALNGKGIAVILSWIVRDDLREGRLKKIMDDYTPTPLEINAVYPERRFLPVKVRLFVDYLRKELKPAEQ